MDVKSNGPDSDINSSNDSGNEGNRDGVKTTLDFDLGADLNVYTSRREQLLRDAVAKIKASPKTTTGFATSGQFVLSRDSGYLSLLYPTHDWLSSLSGPILEGIDVVLPSGRTVPRSQMTLLTLAQHFPLVPLSALEKDGGGIHLPINVSKEALERIEKNADSLSASRRANFLLHSRRGALWQLRGGYPSGNVLACIAATWALYGKEIEKDTSEITYQNERTVFDRAEALPVTDFGVRVVEDLERVFDLTHYVAEHTIRSAPEKAAGFLAMLDGALLLTGGKKIERDVPRGPALLAVHNAWLAQTHPQAADNSSQKKGKK